MKIERTESNEICVTVDEEDQNAYGVRYETMSFADENTRRFCEHVALLVCCRNGIPSGCGRLQIRAVQGKDGCLVLYFSLPESHAETEEWAVYSQTIAFSSVDGLLDCRCVLRSAGELCAEVYLLDGVYYLWYEYYSSSERFDALTLNLLEFGDFSTLDRTYLSEHGTPLPAAVSFFLCES